MQKRIIGKDLTVSAVGLGCMGMSHAYCGDRYNIAKKADKHKNCTKV